MPIGVTPLPVRANRPAVANPPDTVTIPHVVDGFSYNTQLFYLPYRFFPNALAQLDILRRAANYRAKWFVVPDDIDQPIAPFDTLYYQIDMAAGSYIWGWNFNSLTALNPAGAPTETTASDILVQWVDSCTGVPAGMDFQNGFGNRVTGNSKMIPVLPTQPRLILDPGLVNVEISNRTANTITCQLLIMTAEPCKIVDECSREADWRSGLAGLRGGIR